MNPILLQKQLRDNSNDLQDFCKELKDWSSEMKRKEEALKSDDAETPQNKITKQKEKGSGDAPEAARKPNKIKSTDYTAWDKFDVEKECKKIDKQKGSDSDSELTDEYDESMKDQAVFEKEKGNKFVQKQRWDDAIECYTKAIACYGYDPIFYANRALCFLKMDKWKEAESDCTTALQLDKTYVKAYQRRAAAREKLGQLTEAKADLEKVLEYEPKNTESKRALEKLIGNKSEAQKPSEIQSRPISKFTQSRKGKRASSNVDVVAENTESSEQKKVSFDDSKAIVVERKEETVQDQASGLRETETKHFETKLDTGSIWPEDDTIKIIKPISKAPHARSKVPLKRIQIKEIEKPAMHARSGAVKKSERAEIDEPVKIVMKKENRKSVSFGGVVELVESSQSSTPTEKSVEVAEPGESILVEPTTSVQFLYTWKLYESNLFLRYRYLKVINPKNLREIFKEALDSKTYSEILQIMSAHTDDHGFIYGFLKGLSNVRRFSTLILFMSARDKEAVRMMVQDLQSSEKFPDHKINKLMASFQL